VIATIRRLVGTLSATGTLAAITVVGIPVAPAGAQAVDLGPCNSAAVGQPFAPWGDSASYELSPGGDFEGSAWTLSGGAQIVPGSEPFAATGTLGSWSLSLPAGASARSPATCVDAAYPSVRMFIAGTGMVAVEVVYDDLPIPTGVAIANGGWQPTPVMITADAVWGALSGGTATVSLQVTALTGNPQVDDVFIDPWNRGN
jgi:hypothetical protein